MQLHGLPYRWRLSVRIKNLFILPLVKMNSTFNIMHIFVPPGKPDLSRETSVQQFQLKLPNTHQLCHTSSLVSVILTNQSIALCLGYRLLPNPIEI